MNSKGFTLIELVVVIVILGILAATAAPKFINLKADAQTATLQGVKAAIEGVVALVHSKSLVKGNHKEAVGTIILEDGDPLDIGYGYPLAPGPFDPISPENYWQRLLSIAAGDIVIRAATNGKLIFYFSEQGSLFNSNAECIVVYEPPSGINIRPKVTVNPCT